MYLSVSPDFSLRNEVIYRKMSVFFDVDPNLRGQTVLLCEANQVLKKLCDIDSIDREEEISNYDGVFIYRTLGLADVSRINRLALNFPNLSFYMIESGFFSITQESVKLPLDAQRQIQIISSELTHHFKYSQFNYIFVNKSEHKKKTARHFIQNPALNLRKFLLLLIKFFLTPVQSVKDFYATYNLKYFYGKMSVFFGIIWSFFAKYTPKYIFGIIWSFFAKYTPKYVFGMIWSVLAKYNFRYLQGFFWTNFLEGLYNFFCKYNIRYVGGCIWVLVLKIFFTLYRWTLNSLGVVWSLIVRMFWASVFIYHRIHEFNMKFTYYPFRKAYWFLKFQYRKRILGIRDESY